MTSSQCISMVWAVTLGIAGGLIMGYTGWLPLGVADEPGRTAVLLAAVLTGIALLNVASHVSSACAVRRLRAALERYVEQELANGNYSDRNNYAHSQSQNG